MLAEIRAFLPPDAKTNSKGPLDAAYPMQNCPRVPAFVPEFSKERSKGASTSFIHSFGEMAGKSLTNVQKI